MNAKEIRDYIKTQPKGTPTGETSIVCNRRSTNGKPIKEGNQFKLNLPRKKKKAIKKALCVKEWINYAITSDGKGNQKVYINGVMM